jgi:hypothetical protein
LVSAQRLPDNDDVVVRSSLSATNRADFYEVPVNPRSRSYEIELDTTTNSAGTPEQLVVVDASGQVVGKWSVAPPATDIMVELRTIGPAPAPAFFVGILGDPALIGAAWYELRVSQATNSDQASPLDLTTVPAVSGMLPAPALHPDHSGELAVGESQSGDDSPALSPALWLGLAQGASIPLPLRIASPLGGILADGDTTPIIDRRAENVVDLALVELIDEPARNAADTTESASLTVLRGPGGLPLMSAIRPSDSVTNSLAADAIVARSDLPGINEELAPAHAPARRAQVPLHVSLAFMAALSFGALLPDLSSFFDPLRPRRLPRPRLAGIDFGADQGDAA